MVRISIPDKLFYEAKKLFCKVKGLSLDLPDHVVLKEIIKEWQEYIQLEKDKGG